MGWSKNLVREFLNFWFFGSENALCVVQNTHFGHFWTTYNAILDRKSKFWKFPHQIFRTSHKVPPWQKWVSTLLHSYRKAMFYEFSIWNSGTIFAYVYFWPILDQYFEMFDTFGYFDGFNWYFPWNLHFRQEQVRLAMVPRSASKP